MLFAQTRHPTALDYICFSFVTIRTVGYGDFSAALNIGKMPALTETVFGRLHLITVVSLVVQNLGTKRQQDCDAGKPPSG